MAIIGTGKERSVTGSNFGFIFGGHGQLSHQPTLGDHEQLSTKIEHLASPNYPFTTGPSEFKVLKGFMDLEIGSTARTARGTTISGSNVTYTISNGFRQGGATSGGGTKRDSVTFERSATGGGLITGGFGLCEIRIEEKTEIDGVDKIITHRYKFRLEDIVKPLEMQLDPAVYVDGDSITWRAIGVDSFFAYHTTT